jgi:hypothetical protein
MRKLVIPVLGCLVLGCLALATLTFAQEAQEKTPAKAPEKAPEKAVEHQFVGVDGCKICHKSEAKGDQYGKWLASPHAKAFEVLASDEAKAVAKKAGLEGNPQESDACLGCHVTAHGVKAELLGEKYKAEDGVGCESCHGAGGDYKTMKVMKDKDAAIAAGLVLPTEETCKTCHNEKSPTYKEFVFKTAVAKIAHPYPKAEEKSE